MNINICDYQIKTADNVVKTVIGITDRVKINIAGQECELELIIIEHKDHDVLLGLDWFEKSGAGIYPATKVIKFRDFTVRKEGEDWIKEENSKEVSENDENEPLKSVLAIEVLDSDDITPDIDWETNKKTVVPITKYNFNNNTERELWKQLFTKIERTSASSIEELSVCTVRKHKIRVKSELIVNKPRHRRSERERQIFAKEISIMKKAGIIVDSKSEFSSPPYLIPKKDGSYRMIIDYRGINEITETTNFPIPNTLDIFDRLSGSEFFTTLDLKSGYWQVAMEEQSRKYTAFSTPDGHYEFTKLPFGLKNAPAEFSYIMSSITGDLKFVYKV
jgi:hypothetical protein